MGKYVYMALICMFFVRLSVACNFKNIVVCKQLYDENSYQRYKSKKGVMVNFKKDLTRKIRQDLPSPHSELLLGMTLGINEFKQLPIFSKMLRDTGTIHVVVVSGYNVTLVFNLVISMLGTMYKKINFGFAMISTLLFSILSGFDPPVVRAWFMGGIIMLGKFYGLRLNTLLVLMFTALVLLIVEPFYLFSLSFLLSFMATLSLVLFNVSLFEGNSTGLLEDLSSTLSAQILVWPLISFYFGQVSLISPLINMLILWTVPIATILGSVYVVTYVLHLYWLGRGIAYVIYIFLDIFVKVVEIGAEIPFATVGYAIPVVVMFLYYLLVFSFAKRS